jgi:hypothetical protein
MNGSLWQPGARELPSEPVLIEIKPFDGDFFPMQSLKRDITFGFVISAIAVAIAIAWGSPFISPRAAYAEDAQHQMQRQQVQSQPAQAVKAKPHPGIQRLFRQQ